MVSMLLGYREADPMVSPFVVLQGAMTIRKAGRLLQVTYSSSRTSPFEALVP